MKQNNSYSWTKARLTAVQHFMAARGRLRGQGRSAKYTSSGEEGELSLSFVNITNYL